MESMKIGDKVRFLSEVGGGVVTGFRGKDIVLVEDADGFDIPMPVRECVVIETDDYNIPTSASKAPRRGRRSNRRLVRLLQPQSRHLPLRAPDSGGASGRTPDIRLSSAGNEGR